LNRLHPKQKCRIGEGHTHIELQKEITQWLNDHCVVPKLGLWKPMKPFGRASINETPKECFHGLIEMLSLAVGLWMIGRQHLQLNIRNSKKLFLE